MNSSRRFAYVLAYTLAVGVGAVGVAWMVTKMARTEEADFMLLRMAAVLLVGALVVVVSFGFRPGARR